jgi:tight adherence protein C
VSVAVVLAGAAGASAAAGLFEAAALVRARCSRRTRRLALVAVERIGRGMGARAPRLAARIAAAGLDAGVQDVMAVKAGLALLGALIALPLAQASPGRLGLTVMAAAPGAGFFTPDAWLRRRTRIRRRAIEAELADVLDLLRVAVASGLAPRRALAEVGRRRAGALAAELRRAAGRTALGVPSERALAELEARCPADGIAALVAALRRADRHGAPLASALAALAADARARQAQRTAEAAARAAPKIQLVVALLLVPAVMLLIAAALLPAVLGR